ncbi:unnamed protein product [Pichia kudriavzevii]
MNSNAFSSDMFTSDSTSNTPNGGSTTGNLNVYSVEQMVDVYKHLQENGQLSADPYAAAVNSSRTGSLETPQIVSLLANGDGYKEEKKNLSTKEQEDKEDKNNSSNSNSNSSNSNSSSNNSSHQSRHDQGGGETGALNDTSLNETSLNLIVASWYYLDDHHNQQGPFDSTIMQQWFLSNFLVPTLSVRREGELDWLLISDLWEICQIQPNFNPSLAPFNQPLPQIPLKGILRKPILPMGLSLFDSTNSIFNNPSNNSSQFLNNTISSTVNTNSNTPLLGNATLETNTNDATIDSRSNSTYSTSLMGAVSGHTNTSNLMNYLNVDMNPINSLSLSSLNPSHAINMGLPTLDLNNQNMTMGMAMSNSYSMSNMTSLNNDPHLSHFNNITSSMMNPIGSMHSLSESNAFGNLNQLNSMASTPSFNPLDQASMNLELRTDSQLAVEKQPLTPSANQMTDLNNTLNRLDISIQKNYTTNRIEMENAVAQAHVKENMEGMGYTGESGSPKLNTHGRNDGSRHDKQGSSNTIEKKDEERIHEEKEASASRTNETSESCSMKAEQPEPNNVPTPIPSVNLEQHMKALESENKRKMKEQQEQRRLQQEKLMREEEEARKREEEKLAKESERERSKREKEEAASTSQSRKLKSTVAPWASVSQKLPVKSLEEIQREEKLKRDEELKRLKIEENDRLLATRLALEDSAIPTISVSKKKKVISLSELSKPSTPSLLSGSSWGTGTFAPSIPTPSLEEIKREELSRLKADKIPMGQQTIAQAIAQQKALFSGGSMDDVDAGQSDTSDWTVATKKQKPKVVASITPVASHPKNSKIKTGVPKTTPLKTTTVKQMSTASKPTATSSFASSLRGTVSVPTSKAEMSYPAPVVDFLVWVRSQLSDLYKTVNKEDVIQIMMQLPVGSDSQEIIADTIYSNSSTMDGRRFASEFMKKRSRIEETIRKKNWAFDWFEAIENTKNIKISKSSTSTNDDDDWSDAFTVVSKKSRKGN